ncbi:MFS transporter [Nonomuraea sp. K274]|uniref:MFS transporter n=1 Tax=Nonomuraea cypriaca TaxID=1187855 RepID=A0A931AD67_9ACTN|nr:MFS transporter [Nonomuraea cypriaca]MBF8188358.1 MFS transporter [Nonomuraea cypriaca]
MSTPTPIAPAASKAERRRTIIAASAGNFVEWYDAGIYGIVAVVLSKKLFPSDVDPTIALLNTYAVFAISFLLRPFGGIVFGHIADKLSRKQALSITIIATCISTGLIGLIPEYRTIGWLAPVLLLVLRLLQSMGTGGEYSTAISFVYEHGQKGRKAVAVGQLTSLTFGGFLVGALFSTILSALMPASAYESYGWRILFLLALPMGVVGSYLRRKTEESPEFQALQRMREQTKAQVTPLFEALRKYWRRILVFTFFMGSWSVFATLLTNYLPTFLHANKALSATQANAANLLASFMVLVFVLAFSPVADRIGLRKAMIVASIVLIIGIVPGYAIAADGVAGGFLGAAILGTCKGILAVPALLATSQIFPAGIRVTAGGLSYNISASVLGGTAPFVAVWLNGTSETSLLFSSYLIFYGVLTLVITLVYAKGWIAESAAHSGDAATGKAGDAPFTVADPALGLAQQAGGPADREGRS